MKPSDARFCARARFRSAADAIWKVLAAHRRGDIPARNRWALSVRRSQGVSVGQLSEWELDAQALLLLADLQVSGVDPQAVNYSLERLKQLRDELIRDLALLG